MPAIVMNLSVEHLDKRKDARRVVSLFHEAGIQRGRPDLFRDAAMEYARRAKRSLSSAEFEAAWAVHKNPASGAMPSTSTSPPSGSDDALEVLWRHVRRDIGVELYMLLRSEMYVEVSDSDLVLKGEIGLGRVLARHLRGYAFCTPDVYNPRFYLYKPKSRLWKHTSSHQFGARVDTMLQQLDCVRATPPHHLRCLSNRASLHTIAVTAMDWLVDDKMEKALNKAPHLIPVEGGLVIDLVTGTARDRTKDDMFSKEMPVRYDPGIDMTKFNKVVADICVGDPAVMTARQRKYGYGLIAGNPEKKLFYSYGDHDSGKSTLTLCFYATLGPFVIELHESDVLECMTASGGTASPHTADMEDARAGIFSEAGKRVKYNEAKLKKFMTDVIRARKLHSSPIEFFPLLKIYIQSNFAPSFSDDPTLWVKIVIDAFRAAFRENPRNGAPGVDTSLLEWVKSSEAKSAFLNWAVDGARQYLAAKAAGSANPLAITTESVQLHDSLQAAMDPVRRFFDQRIVRKRNARTPITEIREAYVKWATKANETLFLPREFGTRFARVSGLTRLHLAQGDIYVGIVISK
jgi:hypothetical protein